MENSNHQKQKKKLLIIRIIIYVVALSIIGYLGYSLIKNSTDGVESVSSVITLLVGLAIISIPVLIIVASKKHKKYINKLMETKPKHRFNYLDTFYYTRKVYSGDTVEHKFFTYHVLKDQNSGKIYAIPGEQWYTNAMFQYFKGKGSILTGKGIRFANSANWNEVSFNSEGSLWIEEEIDNYLTFDGDKIIFDNPTEKHVLKNQDELSNCNPQYDISLLKQAKFITGYAEFDTNN